ADLVSIAESGRSRYTSLADKAAKLYAPGVHILAALSFLGWLIWSGDIRISVNVAAAVLIITCPCALGLAVPAVTTAASGRMFRMGLLIKDATALERLSQVDTVVFDKTGTLTSGKPSLSNIDEHNDQDLSVALALAEASSHPMSSALVTAVRAESIVPADLTNITEIPGFGVEALWNGKEVRLGRASWTGAASSCETATFLRISDEPAVAFTFIDTLRSGALETVRGLRQSGKSVWLISGDTAGAVQDLANLLCIKDWIAEALPDEKAARVSALMDAGEKVLMVGDGLNDTVALAAAHVSISPASALDAARVASDIVLIGSDLSPIPGALEMAGRATSRIRENFRIATLYNLIAVPIAVFGLATPLVAALAMSASSITVSLNALRLR
ncbi:MAG: heavy metal translocating P-type ATPase, partial [Paracoccaceae bacterium]